MTVAVYMVVIWLLCAVVFNVLDAFSKATGYKFFTIRPEVWQNNIWSWFVCLIFAIFYLKK